MQIGANKGTHLRFAGGSIMVLAAVAQALVIGLYLHDLGSLYVKVAYVVLPGWCLAGLALVLGRFRTPYISFVVPVAVLAGSIWLALAPLQDHSLPYGMIAGTLLMLYIGPVTGAWLAGWGLRRRRRSLSIDVKTMAQVFD